MFYLSLTACVLIAAPVCLISFASVALLYALLIAPPGTNKVFGIELKLNQIVSHTNSKASKGKDNA